MLVDAGQFPRTGVTWLPPERRPRQHAPGFDHQHSSPSERHVIVRAFAGGHPFPSCPGPGVSSSPGTGRTATGAASKDPGACPSRGRPACPAAEHGDRHDRYRCHSPGGTGRLPRTSQPAASPAAPGQGAAPGVVTSCRSQRRCSSGRDDDACVTAGQTANVLWILPFRMPLTGRTFTGFGHFH